MRKSFKKGLAMVLAAAMALSTPVAVNKTVSAATEEESKIEILTGTDSWVGGKDYSLNAGQETVLYVAPQQKANNQLCFMAEVKGTDSEGDYFLSTLSNQEAWTAGKAADVGTITGNVPVSEAKNDTEIGHLYKITAKRTGKDITIVYFDVTANKEYRSFKWADSNMPDEAAIHITPRFGTFVVTTEEPIVGALLSDVKAELNEAGNAIELSYTKKLPLNGLSVTVSGSAAKVEEDITENLAVTGSAVYTYPVEGEGEYKITLTASKDASAEGFYLDDVTTIDVILVKVGDDLYMQDDTLFTDFGVSKTTTDKVFKVDWKAAEGVTAEAKVTDKDGKAVGTTLTAPGNVTVSAEGAYVAELTAKKGNKIKKATYDFSYKATANTPGKTDKFSKITTKPLYKYTFDDAKEVTLSSKATVKDGILNLAPTADKHGEYYAKIDSMTADDFSQGITFIADINVKATAKKADGTFNDWSSIVTFGDGQPAKKDAAGATYRWAITEGFSSKAGPNTNYHEAGYYGSEISQPYTWDYLNIAANQNKWYTVAVTVKKNEMITYINGVQVQKGTADYSTIINGMKKSNNNYLGASYWDADADFAGSMDDVAVYNTALSAADIKTLTRTDAVTGKDDDKKVTSTAKVSKVTIKVPNKKSGKTIYMKVKDKLTLKATVTGTGKYSKSVTWSSSKKKVASVTSKGKVTAKKAGTAKITATSKTDKKKKATITIKVSKKAVKNKALKLKATKKTLKKGKTYTIGIKKITKKTTEKITYKSSKKSVATVDAYGVVKAKKKGKANITVKCGKKKATLKLTVKK